MVPGGRGRLLALYAEVIPGSLNDKIMCQELNRNQQHVKQALYFLHYFLGKILSSLNSCIHFIYFIFYYHHFSKKSLKLFSYSWYCTSLPETCPYISLLFLCHRYAISLTIPPRIGNLRCTINDQFFFSLDIILHDAVSRK